MLTKKFVKKISIMFSCLLVIEIISLFPKKQDNTITKNTASNTGIVYLLDNENYVSRLDVVLSSSKIEDRIKEIIDILTVNNSKNYHIREGFKPLIPENTRLLNSTLKDQEVILNFSKDILKISEDLEEKMIESIVYSLTSLDNIESVSILVNDKVLEYLPHSLKKLSMPLDRSYGVNKEYNLNSVSNINKTTVFHMAKYKDYIYYVPVTKYSNSSKEKIEVIIDELKSTDTLNSNLVSYLSNETKLINYDILDKSMILNFTDDIFKDINSHQIEEEVTYTINMSINENYDKETVIYCVDDEIIDNYFLLRG